MKKGIIAAGCAALLLAGVGSVFAKAGDAAKGKNVFTQCAACHNPDSTEVKLGPGLKGLFKRATLKNGKKVNEDNVRDAINNGGGKMPPFADILTDDDRDNVIAYLKTL